MSEVYSDALVDMAWALAKRAHLGQFYHRKDVDWEYITHIKRVVHLLKGYPQEIIISGILHDVVEDSDVIVDDIEQVFGKRIAHAVAALTHNPGEPYFHYIIRCRKNHYARIVKSADIIDHLTHCVKSDRVSGWETLMQRYGKALLILHGLDN